MLLQNRYRIIQALASGGFGDTYLAEDTQMPSLRRCVIKQLKPINQDPNVYQLVKNRFQKEAELLEKLGQENRQIPQLYGYFEDQGQFYLVQEWIEGQTLTHLAQTQGKLSEIVVKDILVKILPVLNIIHRDIKPANIFITDDLMNVKIGDLNVSKVLKQDLAKTQIGTPYYLAPEIWNMKSYDYKADVFSQEH